MFIIKENFHDEFISEGFDTFEAAYKELQRIAGIPFGVEPNKPLMLTALALWFQRRQK
jgi:hypothetical protein